MNVVVMKEGEGSSNNKDDDNDSRSNDVNEEDETVNSSSVAIPMKEKERQPTNDTNDHQSEYDCNSAEGEEEAMRVTMLAHAFRQANDEDTCLALNAIASRGSFTTSSHYYYAVPFEWMHKLWKVLFPSSHKTMQSQQTSQQTSTSLTLLDMGKIPIADLQQQHQCAHAHHKKDYVIVGSNLWLLLKEKFGCDSGIVDMFAVGQQQQQTEAEIPCPVVKLSPNQQLLLQGVVGQSDGNENGSSGLAVRVHLRGGGAAATTTTTTITAADDLIPIPATGRFPYETWFNHPTNNNNSNNDSTKHCYLEDEQKRKRQPQQQQQQQQHIPDHRQQVAAQAAALARGKRGGGGGKVQVAAGSTGGGGGRVAPSHSKQKQQLLLPQQDGKPPGNVSEEEEEGNDNYNDHNSNEGEDDLFPGDEDHMSMDNSNNNYNNPSLNNIRHHNTHNLRPFHNPSSSSVLLLPAPPPPPPPPPPSSPSPSSDSSVSSGTSSSSPPLTNNSIPTKIKSKKKKKKGTVITTTATTTMMTRNNSSISSSNRHDDEMDPVVNQASSSSSLPRLLRPYGSGLGNLGNTCFMNSTLQCLAHTDPLRKYFLSGAYQIDLNTDNPLGTGGDLAIQFAQLLGEMWLLPAATAALGPSSFHDNNNNNNHHLHVVYPRSFKYTLGRHAEQFVGYDQHDSQELATYLLDALHEDTNRVTHKPYVEKPEQAEDESDEQAAQKAWELHLEREDSQVMEYFMGQVKSRVQCCNPTCNRVSTTFDPFMYLSVPIPGSSERNIKVVFVPLDPMRRPQEITININKQGTVKELLKKVLEYLDRVSGFTSSHPNPAAVVLEDFYVADVWQNDIYDKYDLKDDLEKIRENDETVIYQLEPVMQIQEEERDTAAKNNNQITTNDLVAHLQLRERPTPKRFKLDVATMARINQRDGWANELAKYLRNELTFSVAFNPKRGNPEERVRFFHRLCTFIDQCYEDCAQESAAGMNNKNHNSSSSNNNNNKNNNNSDLAGGAKRMRKQEDSCADTKHVVVSPEEDQLQSLLERSHSSVWFDKVARRYDVAVLEFLAAKVKTEIIRMERDKPSNFPQGIIVQIRMRKSMSMSHKDHTLATSFVIRISSKTTVYRMREILATRLARALRTNTASSNRMPTSSGESTSERPTLTVDDNDEGDDDNGNVEMMMTGSGSGSAGPAAYFGRPEMLILRQIPLTYEKKSVTCRPSGYLDKQLGVLEKSSQFSGGSGRPVALASPTDRDEQVLVAEIVGNEGTVFLEWPETLADRCFDSVEFESVERPTLPPIYSSGTSSSDASSSTRRARRNEGALDVYDCIDKYCQREQLEESEMWYCNRCKEHVRAWKQFHLYRCPPILIVHLKRFQYSATTHRRDKINVFIDFPLTGLDLTSHVAHWASSPEDGIDEKPIYDCYAVSNHYGGLGGGHYTAYCLNDDGVWCYYDDSRVSVNVDPREVVSSSAYVLYYRRRDVRVGEYFVPNLQTMPPPASGKYTNNISTTPAIIHDPESGSSNTSSHKIVVGDSDDVSSSNAAMVDEDESRMDVDEELNGDVVEEEANTSIIGASNHDLDTASRSPSPSPSIDENETEHHVDGDEPQHQRPQRRSLFRTIGKGNANHQWNNDSFPLQ